MSERVINFNPGPSTLPLPALERAQREFLDFEGTGMSILEHSHRGKAYDAVHNEAIGLLRELLQIPDTHEVLLMQGGASAQFAMVPMNLLGDKHADYVVTGSWSKKALAEAKILGSPRVAATTEQDGKFTRVPSQGSLELDPNAAYVHITSNNTIFGTQFHQFPDTGDVPLVADMSSDILWRPIDVSKFGLIYAGAQKNIGPAGVTVVIARKDLIERSPESIPKIFRYSHVASGKSLQNTAPTFAIYMLRNVLAVLKDRGLDQVENDNREKARLLYETVDRHADYFRCPVEPASRSVMNPVFRLPNEDLEKKFVADATERGMVGLKGHRSVGGIRASMYNAMPVSGVQTLVEFMEAFKKANPA